MVCGILAASMSSCLDQSVGLTIHDIFCLNVIIYWAYCEPAVLMWVSISLPMPLYQYVAFCWLLSTQSGDYCNSVLQSNQRNMDFLRYISQMNLHSIYIHIKCNQSTKPWNKLCKSIYFVNLTSSHELLYSIVKLDQKCVWCLCAIVKIVQVMSKQFSDHVKWCCAKF